MCLERELAIGTLLHADGRAELVTQSPLEVVRIDLIVLQPAALARRLSRKRLACRAALSTLDGSTSARMSKLVGPLSYGPLLVFRVARAKPSRTSALAIRSTLRSEGRDFSWNFRP